MFNDKTTIPLGMMSIKAKEDLPANRFVNSQGGLCTDKDLILGVTTKSWKTGEIAAICFSGIVAVEANGIIDAIGVQIVVGEEGKALKSTTGGQNIIGLDTAAAAGKIIRVKI